VGGKEGGGTREAMLQAAAARSGSGIEILKLEKTIFRYIHSLSDFRTQSNTVPDNRSHSMLN
jgi:hypothetical protein